MTRFAAAENEAAVEGAHVPYVVFVEFDFPSGIIRLCSSDRSYSVSGQTYTALGSFGSISGVKESSDGTPDKLEFILAGVPNNLALTTEKYHGRSVAVHIGFVDVNGDLVATPHMNLWEGRMDTIASRSEEGGSSIVVTCEQRLIMWNQASGWLYSHEHQGLLSAVANDKFFDKVAELANKTVRWGGFGVATGGGGGGGGTRPGPPPKENKK